ncbi:hypothetical protein K456DRAFT_1701460 [Colletotrichum gloeosporioides 23]|nr:hypothetical protein K456DRAFT_1701460 [Colletotrichum gloeosporioides 23]
MNRGARRIPSVRGFKVDTTILQAKNNDGRLLLRRLSRYLCQHCGRADHAQNPASPRNSTASTPGQRRKFSMKRVEGTKKSSDFVHPLAAVPASGPEPVLAGLQSNVAFPWTFPLFFCSPCPQSLCSILSSSDGEQSLRPFSHRSGHLGEVVRGYQCPLLLIQDSQAQLGYDVHCPFPRCQPGRVLFLRRPRPRTLSRQPPPIAPATIRQSHRWPIEPPMHPVHPTPSTTAECSFR